MLTIKEFVKHYTSAIGRLVFQREIPTALKKQLYRFRLYTVDLPNGQRIKYRAGSADMYVIEDVFVRDEYQFNKLSIDEHGIVVDIGAHIGSYSLRIAELVPYGQVYSFEPNRDNFRILKKNVRLNQLDNITLHNSAVWSQDTRLSLYLNESNSAAHSVVRQPSVRSKLVKAVALETILTRIRSNTIELIKMDCEGAEVVR